MIEKAKQNMSFIKDFESLRQTRMAKKTPLWLTELKNQSLKRIDEVGFPKSNDEEWKYTNISTITDKKFQLLHDGSLKEKEAFLKYYNKNDINIVLINGKLDETYTTIKNLPAGLEILSLDKAIETHDKELKEIFTKHDMNSFVALNTVLVDTGVFVKTAKKTKIKTLIHIIHVTSSSNGEALTIPRTVIKMDDFSEAEILESHISFTDNIVYFSNPLTDIYLKENANLHYGKAQKESLKAFHIGNTRAWLERNSNLFSLSVSLGSLITRNNLDIAIDGEGAHAELFGLSCLTGSQLADNHTSLEHRAPNCTSNQLYKGILNDASRGVFNGKIFVRPLAQKTNAYQLNKTLLLGKDARIDTKPQLEIFADDVKCTHGATIGQLNEDELFYLQTRCISKDTAKKMLAQGFVDDLIDRIQSKSIKEKLDILLEPAIAQI